MTWEPIDFQGIATLDKSLVDHLNFHLQEEESRLGFHLLEAVHPFQDMPLPSEVNSGPIKLNDAIHELGNKLHRVMNNLPPNAHPKVWKQAVDEVETNFWEFISLLESVSSELFLNIRMISFDAWSKELLDVVESIKSSLQSRLEHIIGAISACDLFFWEYRHPHQDPSLMTRAMRLVSNSGHALDPLMIKNLRKTQEYILFNFKVFVEKYKNFSAMNSKVENLLRKVGEFPVLSMMDQEIKSKYFRLYKLVKFWENDTNSKKLSHYNLQKFFAFEFTLDKAHALLKDYYRILNANLFERSRALKASGSLRFDPEGRKFLSDSLEVYRNELHSLRNTIAGFRELLLRTDANPYIRSRWGFTEWVVAPEPIQTKLLLNLVYDTENLENTYSHLRASILEGSAEKSTENLEVLKPEMYRTIHQMEQPLNSRMRVLMHGKHLVDLLEKFNEIGSFTFDSIELAADVFSKAMRADWKYHVLNEIPEFHDLYHLHVGLTGQSDDRQHRNRIQKFKRLIQQIEGWVEKDELFKHAHEIELDMHDIKGYLQDFYGYVQRLSSEAILPTVTEYQLDDVQRQLLESRYLFSHFFFHLARNKASGMMLRNEFLFVDQYFESIESKLYDLRKSQPRL